MRTTIALVEDHPLVRHVLQAVLATEPGFNVIGETGDGQEALALVERLRPQVLLLDLALPGLHGLEVTRQLTQRTPTTRILVFSLHTSKAYI
jgi:DNA-binding NarL/FixJ family response regulator